MIRLFVGNIGSGKTACAVREMIHDTTDIYSNIITKNIRHNHIITSNMVIKKEATGQKKTGEIVYDSTLNVDFWKQLKKPLNVTLDEAHSIINSRRAMTKKNIIATEWMALLRRVIGSNDGRVGNLTLITQMPYRIDNIARDMAHQIRFHRCHYLKRCKRCGFTIRETNEIPEPINKCLRCGYDYLKKFNHIIEVFCFKGITSYEQWKENGSRTYYRHYYIKDIEKIFPLYDTLQWDNLFDD